MATRTLLIALLIGCLAGSAAAQGRTGAETEEERVFADAEAALDAGRYAEAAALYDRALSLNPTRPATLVKRATLYFRERRYGQAIDLLLRAERLAPEDPILKTVLGLCLYQSGQTARALGYLEEVTARRPETYAAQLQLGQHYARRDPERAIAALNLYLRYRPEEQRPLDAVAQLHLGQAYFLQVRLREARAVLEAALRARPHDPQTQLSLGAVLLQQGEYQRAARLFEPFAADLARRPRVAYNLAQVYLHLGRFSEANRLAARYVELVPQDPRGQILLGDVVLSGGREVHVRTALRHYEEAARLVRRVDPAEQPRVSLEARVARAHLVGRDLARAFAESEAALQRLPRGPGAAGSPWRVRQEAELLTVLIEAAVQEVEAGQPLRAALLSMGPRLAQLLPQDAGAQALAGSAALATGSLDRARRHYADALALDGRHRRARAGMVRTLTRLALQGIDEPSGPATALPLLEQALPLDDTTTTARNLAAVYLMLGRPADAERVLQSPLQGVGRRDVSLLRLRARATLALRPAEASAIYEQAIAEATQQLATVEARERSRLQNRLAELRVELGACHLAAGHLDQAIEVLEQAAREAEAVEEVRRALSRNLSLAYLARGRARLGEYEAQLAQGVPPGKLAEAALDDLTRAVDRGGLQPGRRETGAALCAAALAATQATRYERGRELLARAQAEGGCDLQPPHDRLGLELLSAYLSYRDTGNVAQRERALRLLPRLLARASGIAPLQALVRALLRSTNQMLAYDYYALGKGTRAMQLLRATQRSAPRGEDDPVLVHNLAVLELSEGRGSAERILERLAGRPPEALVNLGILRDRRGEFRKALELFRRAQERGARVPRLREWIDVKERILGSAP